jgi:hypothetical protein
MLAMSFQTALVDYRFLAAAKAAAASPPSPQSPAAYRDRMVANSRQLRDYGDGGRGHVPWGDQMAMKHARAGIRAIALVSLLALLADCGGSVSTGAAPASPSLPVTPTSTVPSTSTVPPASTASAATTSTAPATHATTPSSPTPATHPPTPITSSPAAKRTPPSGQVVGCGTLVPQGNGTAYDLDAVNSGWKPLINHP